MIFSNIQRVLVLAPHTDDGELGAGATIARLVEEGAHVFYAAFSIAEESVPEGFPRDVLATEVLAATAELGIRPEDVTAFRFPVRHFPAHRQEILEEIIRLRRAIRPNLVLAPATTDVHQDHGVIASEAMRAFKSGRLIGYELIWNNVSFSSQLSVRLDQSHITRKQRALAAYKSQAGRDYTSGEFIEALARTRGVQIGAQFAEAFEVMRWVTD
jgi:LmbE family N-acetylglucosaminyl deacetylase